MNMLRKLTLLALACALPAGPALAQVPNPGPGWYLTNQNTVKDWVPNPDGDSGGQWRLVDVRDRTYFVENGAVSHVEDRRTRQEGAPESDGVSNRYRSNDQIIARTPGEAFKSDLQNPFHHRVEGSFWVTTKLSRFDEWEDRVVQWDWKTYVRMKAKHRDEIAYRYEWTDPVTQERLSDLDLNVQYGPWAYDAAKDDLTQLAASGNATESQHIVLAPVDRELVILKVAAAAPDPSAPLEAAAGSRNSTYTSDMNTNSQQVKLQGGKVRALLSANQAASTVAQVSSGTPPSGGNGKTTLSDGAKLLADTLAKVKPRIRDASVTFDAGDGNVVTLYRYLGQVKIKGFGNRTAQWTTFDFTRKDHLVAVHFKAGGHDYNFTIDLDHD